MHVVSKLTQADCFGFLLILTVHFSQKNQMPGKWKVMYARELMDVYIISWVVLDFSELGVTLDLV